MSVCKYVFIKYIDFIIGIVEHIYNTAIIYNINSDINCELFYFVIMIIHILKLVNDITATARNGKLIAREWVYRVNQVLAAMVITCTDKPSAKPGALYRGLWE